MKLKKIAIVPIIIISGFLLIFAYLALPWVIIGLGMHFGPNPPVPEITYGEFPFQLEYEIEGERKIIEDIIICEFDGFEQRGEAGRYRKWKTTFKSGKERIVLLNTRDLNITDEWGKKILEFNFYFGNAEYYMGDSLANNHKSAQDFNWVEYLYQTADGIIGGSALKAEEAYEKYKIRLIRWEASSPIQNTFK